MSALPLECRTPHLTDAAPSDAFRARWERCSDIERAVVDKLADAHGPFATDAARWEARRLAWEQQYLPVYLALQDAELYLVEAMHHTLLQILAGAAAGYLDAHNALPTHRNACLRSLQQAHDALLEFKEGQKARKRKKPARQRADNASATTGQRAHLKTVQGG